MAYDGSIVFETKVDTTGFSSGAEKINHSLGKVKAGAEDAARGVEKLPDQLDETSSSTSHLSKIVQGSGVFKLVEKLQETMVGGFLCSEFLKSSQIILCKQKTPQHKRFSTFCCGIFGAGNVT